MEITYQIQSIHSRRDPDGVVRHTVTLLVVNPPLAR